MSNFETNYQPLASQDNGDESVPESGSVVIHDVPERTQFNHIHDLDAFFKRVYSYYQERGFVCIVTACILDVISFTFMVFFATFLYECVDYAILFGDKRPPTFNSTYDTKITLRDAFIPINQCVKNFNGLTILCLIVASLFWAKITIRMVRNAFQYYGTKSFYRNAMKISDNELDNLIWAQVLQRLQEAQREQQMCIHKTELTELDISHRILRYKNYFVAMINKDILPLKFDVPFLGEQIYLSNGLKFNLELILFWGPWAPFENWRLKDDYKKHSKRKELEKYLAIRILWIGMINLVLAVFIFIWQCLNTIFNYTEVVKRAPERLSMRVWSNYGRLYLRHFNELNHELDARLNRAYTPSNKYLNLFSSPVLAIIAKNVQYIAASIFCFMFFLTAVDEDVLRVEHVVSLLAGLTITIKGCNIFIPEENLVIRHENLLRTILANVHYMPDHWKENPRSIQVRNEFSQILQYRAVNLIQEMISPLVTPFIIMFILRRHILDIIDFFRNFTVEVVGVGDICSFAQMDVRKHGHPRWLPQNLMTESNQINQAENGKTELSLVQFALANPGWKPPEQSNNFVTQLREHTQQSAANRPWLPEENSMYSSSSYEAEYSTYARCMLHPMQPYCECKAASQAPGTSMSGPMSRSAHRTPSVLTSGVSQTEGPIPTGGTGMYSHINPMMMNESLPYQSLQPNHMMLPTETVSYDMSYSALYVHDMHRRNSQMHNYADTQAKTIWLRHEMPDIQESTQEEDKEESLPLLDIKPTKSS